MQTQIGGTFRALLTDLSVDDVNEQIFAGMSFSSEAFSVWYAPLAFQSCFDHSTQTPAITINPTETKEIELSTPGRITCTTGAVVFSKGHTGTIKSSSTLRIDFHAPVPLDDVVRSCLAFDRLFGFLIGSRGKPPTFTTWLSKIYKTGGRETTKEGTLEIAGEDWCPGQVPQVSDCVHTQGLGGGTLKTILENFMSSRDDFLDRIHAIEFSRHYSKNLNDRFSVLMPILEAYLKRRYTAEDEENYIKFEKAFFDWVESSNDENIVEFSRKHIEVKARKAPSLSTLLSRAISFVNSKGFAFPNNVAARIQSRRGRLFHSSPRMSEDEARKFYIEVQAATGLLMLHTYDDLGIDIASFAESYFPLYDLRPFFKRRQ
jgi:hypothetical protein